MTTENKQPIAAVIFYTTEAQNTCPHLTLINRDATALSGVFEHDVSKICDALQAAVLVGKFSYELIARETIGTALASQLSARANAQGWSKKQAPAARMEFYLGVMAAFMALTDENHSLTAIGSTRAYFASLGR